MLTLIQWIQSKESLVRVLCDVLQVEELVDQRCVCWYYDCTLCSLHIHGTSCPHYIGKEAVPLLCLSLDDIIIYDLFWLRVLACLRNVFKKLSRLAIQSIRSTTYHFTVF